MNQLKKKEIQVPSIYIETVLLCLDEKGIDYQDKLAAANIRQQDLQRPAGKIPLTALEHLAEALAAVMPDPDFWMYCGTKLTLSTHGTLGLALMNCSTLEEALEFFHRYYQIQIPSLIITKTVSNEHVELVIEYSTMRHMASTLDTYMILSSVHHNLLILTGQDSVPIEYCINQPKPENTSVYQSYLGESIFFDAEEPKVRFPINFLQQAVVFSNPLMRERLRRQCEAELKESMIPNNLAINVRRLITATPGYFASIEQVAEQLEMSVRTLRRKLGEQDSSFRELTDEIKLQKAKQYLEQTSLSIENLADLLCYSDTANFRRAFIRWTNMSPAVYRESLETKKH